VRTDKELRVVVKMVRWTEADSAINAVADLCLAPLLGVVFSSIF
jgi:hypothetical protein